MRSQALFSQFPRTEAVRRALRSIEGPGAMADLLFLEASQWIGPRDLANLLRAGQIRRANPELVAEIEAELKMH
jgi:hypothetical protein